MDNAAAAYYIVTFFSVVAVLVVTGVLIWLASRMRKEQTFVGFKRSRDEMYAGYALLAIGIAVIVVAVIEIMLLLTGQVAAPFGLTYISLAGITFPGEITQHQLRRLFLAAHFVGGWRKNGVTRLRLAQGHNGKAAHKNLS